jgi:hypothetical protein
VNKGNNVKKGPGNLRMRENIYGFPALVKGVPGWRLLRKRLVSSAWLRVVL